MNGTNLQRHPEDPTEEIQFLGETLQLLGIQTRPDSLSFTCWAVKLLRRPPWFTFRLAGWCWGLTQRCWRRDPYRNRETFQKSLHQGNRALRNECSRSSTLRPLVVLCDKIVFTRLHLFRMTQREDFIVFHVIKENDEPTRSWTHHIKSSTEFLTCFKRAQRYHTPKHRVSHAEGACHQLTAGWWLEAKQQLQNHIG